MIYCARDGQTLPEHIKNTANYTKEFADVFGCANMGYTIGLLHDFGKYTQKYQDYLARS